MQEGVSESSAPSPDTAGRTRDHLANERTFLAWVRTALGLIGLGFVIARMGLFLRQMARMAGDPPARRLPVGHEFMMTGVVFLILGTLLCAWAGWLYHRSRKAIDLGRYEPNSATVVLLTALIVTGGVVIVGLVVWST